MHQLEENVSSTDILHEKLLQWTFFCGSRDRRIKTNAALFPLRRTILQYKPASGGNYLSRNMHSDKNPGQPNWIKATLNLLSLSAYLLCSCECKAVSSSAFLTLRGKWEIVILDFVKWPQKPTRIISEFSCLTSVIYFPHTVYNNVKMHAGMCSTLILVEHFLLLYS